VDTGSREENASK